MVLECLVVFKEIIWPSKEALIRALVSKYQQITEHEFCVGAALIWFYNIMEELLALS
jgi:hypothetical protein